MREPRKTNTFLMLKFGITAKKPSFKTPLNIFTTFTKLTWTFILLSIMTKSFNKRKRSVLTKTITTETRTLIFLTIFLISFSPIFFENYTN